jgi:putative transcriptional regulator
MSDGPYFEGDLLVAMPSIGDPRFERSVIYMCAHGPNGAMGLIINKRMRDLTFESLLDQLQIETPQNDKTELPLYVGGPVEPGRGFVLHSSDYEERSTTHMPNSELAITATADILGALAQGAGPAKAIIVLGYAGWQPGQLDRELGNNGWLTTRATADLLFNTSDDKKWSAALASLGIDVAALASDVGHA